MNKPVDNRREMRITACFLWIPSWIAENKKWLAAGPCAAFAEAVIMLSPLETGTTWGWPRERGRSRETGLLARVPGPGGRRAAPGKASQLAGLARRGRVRPLHLIHGGALPDSARQERLCQAGTPATAVMPAATTWGHDRARARSPGGPPGRSAGAAAPAADPCRTVGVLARKTGCRVVARAASARPDRTAGDPGSDGQGSRRARCSSDSGPGKAASGDRGSCGQPPGRAPG